MIGTSEVWVAKCDHRGCEQIIQMKSKYEVETAIKMMGWKVRKDLKVICPNHIKRAGMVTLENSGEKIIHVHDPSLCEGQVCVIHHMTEHNMRSFPQHWRSDRQLMERICTHGVGHPDPDQREYLMKKMGEENAHYEFIHGCDGCCREKVAG